MKGSPLVIEQTGRQLKGWVGYGVEGMSGANTSRRGGMAPICPVVELE